ncbi:Scr1 family TA system antitoxin-like transcriptional regulator [Streptomyces sp. NPDC056529]|uniref:Scr1 family TA system antitoxin-like transcriptional regulator n=1 Tax=Streptomyces sp. NPDC056529 TaxID=3345855 RepID=UPI0036D042DE
MRTGDLTEPDRLPAGVGDEDAGGGEGRGVVAHGHSGSSLWRFHSRCRQRDPPFMLVVLDESCVRRPIGGAAVMDAQLHHLVDFAERPDTMLQVAPISLGERRPFNLPASTATLADRSVIAYGESHLRGFVEREITAVRPVLVRFLQLQAVCLSQAESVAMIQGIRKGTP